MIPRLGLLCQSFWPSFQAFGEQFLHLTHIFSCGKRLFSTLTKRKKTVFRTWPVSSKELAQTNAKGAFCRAGPCRLCIHHRDTFVYFSQAAFPNFRLRMDKGIIANFSGAFIKFVMICMVCVMKCLVWHRCRREGGAEYQNSHLNTDTSQPGIAQAEKERRLEAPLFFKGWIFRKISGSGVAVAGRLGQPSNVQRQIGGLLIGKKDVILAQQKGADPLSAVGSLWITLLHLPEQEIILAVHQFARKKAVGKK